MGLYLDKTGLGRLWAKCKSTFATLNKVYPVGSIYMSVDSTNPKTLFGGTWVQLQNRFLLGAGSSYSNGATGGEATHKLTINEMPKHMHKVQTYYSNGSAGSCVNVSSAWANCRIDGDTATVGGDQPHNNMPPYLVVYMWKRTA